jgi:hypothetical protein
VPTAIGVPGLAGSSLLKSTVQVDVFARLSFAVRWNVAVTVWVEPCGSYTLIGIVVT